MRPGAYPRVEHLKGFSMGQAQALPENIRPWLESLAMDKRSSLSQKVVTYNHNMFYSIGP